MAEFLWQTSLWLLHQTDARGVKQGQITETEVKAKRLMLVWNNKIILCAIWIALF